MANAGRYHAPPTNSDQERAPQVAPTVAPTGDESRLPRAVVVPQRRPSDRARGFVRAYAPDLLCCGIDQETFLRFIDGLNKSVASNPAVEAVNIAGEAVGAVPGSEFVGAPIVGAALQVAAGAYKEVNARKGQNGYLVKMNDELFRPRGLYCLIMSYDVKSRSNVVRPGQSDSPSHIIRQGISQGTKSSSMRSNDGILGASNFPAAAQLVYVGPKNALGNNVEENSGEERVKPGAWGQSRTKVQSMLTAHADKEDLKSQAKFQKKNPTSPINCLMDPKVELSEKDRQKQEKREAEQDKKEKKREREAEKRALKYPDKAPKVHKPKEVVLSKTSWSPILKQYQNSNQKWPQCFRVSYM
ncbi:hypothetical protein INS49_013669 [Diaporthe citri]|uniref:uncharacterized protein n=1 Tax=Diaporthe citri TaxID=83186 RepID=UPI001C7F37FD|nr:uncharacterized protein INS49_013669 [Diaporthe citri]KAG6357790.1 hypothetical protein INS49_013669 [Diaporthe citri]